MIKTGSNQWRTPVRVQMVRKILGEENSGCCERGCNHGGHTNTLDRQSETGKMTSKNRVETKGESRGQKLARDEKKRRYDAQDPLQEGIGKKIRYW